MNLKTAVETVEYHEPSLTYDENPDIRLALKLCMEAAKCLEEMRADGYALPYLLLPGETEE